MDLDRILGRLIDLILTLLLLGLGAGILLVLADAIRAVLA